MQTARGASLSDADAGVGPRPRPVLFVATLVVCLGVDQLTKWLAERGLDERAAPRPLLGEVLQLRLAYNPGAAFSTGTAYTWVFTTLAIVATVVVVVVSRRAAHPAWAVTLGILGGGITGNLTDRLLREPAFFRGHVVDFLMLPNWPIFNLADVFINVAAGLILLHTFRGLRLDGSREPAAARGER